MTTEPAAEPTPHRDNGPYADRDQARAQWDAVTFGLPPASPQQLNTIVLTEALLMAGVKLSDYERQYVEILGGRVSPELCQMINGWIMRAYLSGIDSAKAAV